MVLPSKKEEGGDKKHDYFLKLQSLGGKANLKNVKLECDALKNKRRRR